MRLTSAVTDTFNFFEQMRAALRAMESTISAPNRCLTADGQRREQLLRDIAKGDLAKQRQLSKLLPAAVPPDFDINELIADAKKSGPRDVLRLWKTGGKYDFKKGGRPQYQEFGNWAAGAFAEASPWMTQAVMQRGAGAYQEFFQPQNYMPEFGHAWDLLSDLNGDHPEDSAWIANGYQAGKLLDEGGNGSLRFERNRLIEPYGDFRPLMP